MTQLVFPAPDPSVLDREACLIAESDMAEFLVDALAPAHRRRLFEHVMACHLCLQALVACVGERESPPADQDVDDDGDDSHGCVSRPRPGPTH